jgi:hypothetical protein
VARVQSQAALQGTRQVALHHTLLEHRNRQLLLPLQEGRRNRQGCSLLVCCTRLLLLLVLRRTAAAAGCMGGAAHLAVWAGRDSRLVRAAASASPAPAPSCKGQITYLVTNDMIQKVQLCWMLQTVHAC